MGNGLCNTKKKNTEEKKNLKVIVTNHSRQSVVGQQLEDLIRNKKDNKLNEIGDNYLSFLPEQENNVSFVLYGEDLSKVRNSFLADLNNMKDYTLKLSKNDLLLLTEENKDILKILRSNNIDPKTLFGQGTNQSGTNLSVQQNVIQQNQDYMQNQELPDFVKAKYNKMVQKSFLNSQQLSGKYLNTSFMLEEEFENDTAEFLKKQNILCGNRKMDVWDCDTHELVFVDEPDKEFHLENDDLWKVLYQLAIQANTPIDQKHKPNNNIVMLKELGSIETIEVANFRSQKVLGVLLAMLNFDRRFQTNQLKRLIYPHANGTPIRTPQDIYIVKINANGTRRAIFLQEKRSIRYTESSELYPLIIENALQTFYGDVQNFQIQDIVFRLTNWIPEIIYVKDIGNAESSFQKLKENFDNGHLMIFYNNPQNNRIKPILKLEVQDGFRKKMILTTSDTGLQKFIMMDWMDLYSTQSIQNLYINWNPTIYNFRKKVHFRVPVKFAVLDSPFYNPAYKANRYGQILLTISPHNEQAETRIVLEKHTNVNSIKYNIKYYLYHFYNNRMSVVEKSLKEMQIKESTCEILSDLIIFEKNKAYENYILMFQLVPENQDEYNKMPLNQKEVLTLSIFSFADFNIVEIPFKKIDCYHTTNYLFNIPEAPVIQKQNYMIYPMFKMTCNYFGYYEIRVQGQKFVYYGIYIYKYQNYKNLITSKQFIKGSPEKNEEVCSLNFKLEVGTYIVQIVPMNKQMDIQDPSEIPYSLLNIEKHEISVQFISYSDILVKSFEEHLPNKENFTYSELKRKFQIETITNSQQMKVKKILKGNWNKANNYGTMRAKADCYQKFMKNPGFVVQVEEESELKFILKANKTASEKEPYLAICVIEILDDFKFKFLVDDNYQQGFQYETEDLLLSPNLYGYLILCFNLSEEWEGSFELTVLSDKKLKGIRDNSKCLLKLLNESKPIEGMMNKGSGGHINHSDFLFNPVYSIQIEGPEHEQVIFFAEIQLDSKEVPCSIYLYNSPKQSLFEFDQQEIQNGDYNPAFLYEINSIYKVMNPGRYLLVPSTLNPIDKNIPFEFKLYCSHKFKVQQTNFLDFTTEFVQNIPDCIQYKLKFKLKIQTKTLIILQSGISEIEVNFQIQNISLNNVIYEKRVFLRESFLHHLLVLNNIDQLHEISLRSNKNSPFVLKIFTSSMDALEIVKR